MKRIILLAVVLVFIALSVQTATASTATMNWEVQVASGTSGVLARSLAVDQATGDIYVMQSGGRTAKYNMNGELQFLIGPTVGTVTFPTGNPTGLAVDPKTGYLYMSNNATGDKNIHVVDATTSTVVYIRNVVTSLGSVQNLAFNDDGSKLYATGFVSAMGDIGAREFVRDTMGTPEDYTDDIFVQSGIDLVQTGIMLALNFGDPRGCTVDRNGKVYITDLHGTKRPIRRYLPGTYYDLELEFYGLTKKSWGCGTDAQGNFWNGDVEDTANHRVRCYSGGLEVFSFDVGDGVNGHILCPYMVACDRARNRVIVAGPNGATSSAMKIVYLQSWSVSLDTPQLGTITGNVVDAETGSPVPSVTAMSLYSPYYYPTSYGVTFYGLSSPGTYSYDVNPGLYNVRAISPGYLSTAISHNEVLPGQTLTVPDIPLLPMWSEYVKIQLGEHNLEQGLFLRSTVPGAYIDTQPGAAANFATNIGGRECRGFARPENRYDENFMNLEVDDAFAYQGSAPLTFLEVDYFDTGLDRFGVQMDTAAHKHTYLGWIIKEGTQGWRKLLMTRPDAYFGNLMDGSCDFRFYGHSMDTMFPPGPEYISQVIVRKIPTESSYQLYDSIADLRQLVVAQIDPGKEPTVTAYTKGGGYAVMLTDKIVTAAFDGYFYIADPDRAAGIRVTSPDPRTIGEIVTVKGQLTAVPENQEVQIIAYTVEVTGTTTNLPGPLAMNQKAAAGGPSMAVSVIDGVPYGFPKQPGVLGGNGLQNVGLLCRVYGKVTAVNEFDWQSAWIDDGSGMKSESDTTGDHYGVKIVGSAVSGLTVDQKVIATGIMSLGYYKPEGAPGYYYPVLLLRDDNDLVKLP